MFIWTYFEGIYNHQDHVNPAVLSELTVIRSKVRSVWFHLDLELLDEKETFLYLNFFGRMSIH